MEDDIKEFFDFFQENKNYLPNEKMKNEEIYYAGLDSRFKEYFDALKDYAKYKEWHIDVIPVNPINPIWPDEESDKLTKEKILEYMWQFDWLQTSSMGVEIENDYYKVYGVFIWGKTLSFRLYPLRNYFMDNIKENSEPMNGTYKVWNNPDPNFFQRFAPIIKPEPETCEKDPKVCCGDGTKVCCDEAKKQCAIEEEYILRFIRDNLLGGDLKDLIDSNVFTISYPNVEMEKTDDWEYDIFIKNAVFRKGGTLNFSSEYLTKWRTKVFKDIVLKPYKRDNPVEYINIKVIGVIWLNSFEDDMEIIAKNYSYVESVFNKVIEVLDIYEISITYALRTWKFSLKFDYNGENVNIVLNKDELENIFVWNSTQGLLLNPTKYRNVEKYLNKLK